MARRLPTPPAVKDKALASFLNQMIQVAQQNDDDAGNLSIPAYTLNTLPKALLPYRIIMVKDASGGPTVCVNDGSVWRVLAEISTLTQVA